MDFLNGRTTAPGTTASVWRESTRSERDQSVIRLDVCGDQGHCNRCDAWVKADESSDIAVSHRARHVQTQDRLLVRRRYVAEGQVEGRVQSLHDVLVRSPSVGTANTATGFVGLQRHQYLHRVDAGLGERVLVRESVENLLACIRGIQKTVTGHRGQVTHHSSHRHLLE
ncbi:hypothetical protein D3C71_1163260 [compost metagenome]